MPLMMNEAGQVIGDSYTAGDTAHHGFVWQDGIVADLSLGGSYSYVSNINEAGQRADQ